jgi:hypothetical protein
VVRSRLYSIIALGACAFGAMALTVAPADAGPKKDFQERCFADGGNYHESYGSDGTIYQACIICTVTTKTPRVCKIAYTAMDVPPSVDPKPAGVPPPVADQGVAPEAPGPGLAPIPMAPNSSVG